MLAYHSGIPSEGAIVVWGGVYNSVKNLDSRVNYLLETAKPVTHRGNAAISLSTGPMVSFREPIW
jgi:hypothetical protein